MFCTNCGAKLEEGQIFCTKCGKKIKTLPQGETQPVPLEQSDQHSKQQQEPESSLRGRVPSVSKKHSKKKAGVVAGIVAVLLIAAGGGTMIGVSLNQNNKYNKFADEIAAYAIPTYIQREEELAEEWDAVSKLAFSEREEILDEMEMIRQSAKEADEKLKDLRTTLDGMLAEKDNYNLSDEFAGYEDVLGQCDAAIEERDIDLADSLMDDAEESLEDLIRANKDYVTSKLSDYDAIDWSVADVTDKNTYLSETAKISDLLDKEEFGELREVFETLDGICSQYIEPENDLDIVIQQVDASAYPNVRLYMNLTDRYTGEVPENLDEMRFFIRKKDTNGDYVKQVVSKVNQLDELEALNIDMVADVSGSMYGTPLLQAQNVMINFINSVQFAAGDKVELTSFSTGVYLEEEFCDRADILISDINNLQTDDMTSLYDALYTAVTRVASQQGAKCVIAFTDGCDNYSDCTSQDVISIAQRYRVPIFIVGVGGEDYSDISNIALQTGGRYYSVYDIDNMASIYEEIYRQEKEMYLIEFTDTAGNNLSDEVSIIAGYHSAEYGGECYYDFQPNLLISVESANVYTSGPEATVESYLKGFDDAMTEQDFSYISDYLKTDSNIYNSQKEYVKKGFSEKLDSYEIVSVDYMDEENCVVTTRETFYVQKPGEPLQLMTQQCQYKLEKGSDGWKMSDFAGAVNVLSRINN